MIASAVVATNKTMLTFVKSLDGGKPFKRVSQEELTNLVVRAQQGDENAKLLVIKNTYRFVMKFVYKSHARFSIDADDLIQVGLMGVLTAIEQFKAELGFSFLTYSGHWIHQHIERHFKNDSKTIRVPIHAWEAYSKLCKGFVEYKEIHGNDAPESMSKASNELLCEISGLSDDKIRTLKANFMTGVYNIELDAPLKLNNGEDTLDQGDVFGELSIDESITVVDDIQSLETTKHFLSVLKALPPKERFIIIRRFGILNDGEGETLEEIGRLLDVTRERVRQIETIGLRMLKFKLSRCYSDGILSIDEESLRQAKIKRSSTFKDTSIFREAELDIMSDCL